MQPHDIQRILIIRFSSIGDIVLTTPAIRAVRRRFPQARLDMVTKRQFAELLETNPHLNHLYQYDARGGLRGLLALGRELRRVRYDLCLDLHNNFRSRLLRVMIGAAEHAAFSKQIVARTLLVRAKINRYRGILPVAERYLNAAVRFGAQDDGAGLELFPTPEQEARVARLFEDYGLRGGEIAVGLGAMAAHPLKQWPLEKFAALGRRLAERHQARLIIFGGPADRRIGETLARQLPNRPIVLCGGVSLLESAVALKRCAVFVGNDTGTVHLAAAMRRPVVALFGPTVEEFGFYPYRTPARVIARALPCRPCTHTGKGRCRIREYHACMERITVEEVFSAVEELL